MFKYKLTLWTTATSHTQTDKHTPHTQANSLQRVLVGDWSVIRRCFFYSAPAGTPVAPPRSSLFLFHPSFVTVCQGERKKTKKQLRALKCLIHLPPLRLWSVCLFLLAGRSRSASDLFSDQHILAQFSLPLMFVCPFELVSFSLLSILFFCICTCLSFCLLHTQLMHIPHMGNKQIESHTHCDLYQSVFVMLIDSDWDKIELYALSWLKLCIHHLTKVKLWFFDGSRVGDKCVQYPKGYSRLTNWNSRLGFIKRP